MLPLFDWHPSRDIIGVFTDIDDTLTTEGAITPDAMQALADLKAAGLHVVPITGRPVGWSEPFVSRWPVDAIVAENGAVGLTHSPAQGLHKCYQQDAATRATNFHRMQQVLAQTEFGPHVADPRFEVGRTQCEPAIERIAVGDRKSVV